jgi:hypothetical protein
MATSPVGGPFCWHRITSGSIEADRRTGPGRRVTHKLATRVSLARENRFAARSRRRARDRARRRWSELKRRARCRREGARGGDGHVERDAARSRTCHAEDDSEPHPLATICRVNRTVGSCALRDAFRRTGSEDCRCVAQYPSSATQRLAERAAQMTIPEPRRRRARSMRRTSERVAHEARAGASYGATLAAGDRG